MIVVWLTCAFLAGACLAAVVTARYRVHAEVQTDVAVVEPDQHAASTTELARRVLQTIDVGVVVVGRDEQVMFANPVADAMMLLDADRLVTPALRALVRQVTDSGTGASVQVDLSASRRGPAEITYLAQATPLADDGRVSAVLLRFSDVTESRRLELVRRDFVANVSHELKTPVGALSLLAEAVQDAAGDPRAVERFAERMQRESARLGRLVQELIELSRLQGAEPLPGHDIVSVAALIHEAMDRTRLVAEQSGIAVVERSENGLSVRGNETQLANAVANLVDNAIAYSPERTKVGVTARLVTSPDGAREVEIAVTDQGIGIAESELDRVFERFYRVDPARSRATGGTGLGLAIVKHIATNHGGTVSVWSVVGSGSTFTIRLPVAVLPGDAVGPPLVALIGDKSAELQVG